MKRVERQVSHTQMNETKVSLKLLMGSWGIELIKMILPLKCWCEGSFSNFSCGGINLMWFWWIMLTLKKQGFELCRSTSQFSSVQSLSRVWLFAPPWIAACQASLSITNSRSSPKLLCIESVMPFSHLILRRPLLLLPPVLPSISLVFNLLHVFFLSS